MGRTFIQPGDAIRNLGVKLKHNANRPVIQGKRIVLIDDSIVRGTTSVKIVQMIRDAGAREVHIRVASPMIYHSDYYGIDTPHRDQLIAAQHTVEEIRNYLGADSLSYLSLEGLRESVGVAAPNYCNACYTREYPVEPPSDAEAYMQMVFKLPDGAEPIEP